MKTFILSTLLILMIVGCFGQDYLVRINGSKIPVQIIEIDEDVVKFRNYSDKNAPMMTIEKSALKYVKYENGETQNFFGAYKNLSAQDSVNMVKQINVDDDTVYLEEYKLWVENLFRQNRLFIDLSNNPDTNFVPEKGKILVGFEGSKNLLRLVFYPMPNRVVYTKFDFNLIAQKKDYDRLRQETIASLEIQSGKSNPIHLDLDANQAETLMRLFEKYYVE